MIIQDTSAGLSYWLYQWYITFRLHAQTCTTPSEFHRCRDEPLNKLKVWEATVQTGELHFQFGSCFRICSVTVFICPSPLLELFPVTLLWIFFPCWRMWTGECVLSAFDLPVDHLSRRAVTLLGYSGFISMLGEPKTAHQDKGDEVTVVKFPRRLFLARKIWKN